MENEIKAILLLEPTGHEPVPIETQLSSGRFPWFTLEGPDTLQFGLFEISDDVHILYMCPHYLVKNVGETPLKVNNGFLNSGRLCDIKNGELIELDGSAAYRFKILQQPCVPSMEVKKCQFSSPGLVREGEKRKLRRSVREQRKRSKFESEQMRYEEDENDPQNTAIMRLLHQLSEVHYKLAQAEIAIKKSLLIFKEEILGKIHGLLDTQLCCMFCADVYIHPVMFNCGHRSCAFCISQWQKLEKNSCPGCKTKIDKVIPDFALRDLLDGIYEVLPETMKEMRQQSIQARKKAERDLPPMVKESNRVDDSQIITIM